MTDSDVRELAESWLNGNHGHVAKQIERMPPVDVVRFTLALAEWWYSPNEGLREVRRLVRFLNKGY